MENISANTKRKRERLKQGKRSPEKENKEEKR